MIKDRNQTHSMFSTLKAEIALNVRLLIACTPLLPLLLFSGCGNDAQIGMKSGKSVGGETTQSRDGDSPSLQILDGSYSIKFLQPTLLKASPDQSSTLPADKKCGIRAGLHLAVYEKPAVVNSHWFVKIKGNPEGCGFSEGYVYEQHVVVPELARANYMLPLPGAVVTSTWCTCRNIGTSPHIGLDLAKGGIMKSYALSGSYVQSVVFNGGCGWEVTLRDDGGAVWLYRHLNQPALQRGQKLKMGDYVGLHQNYPDSSCGNGAHLHLERLTSGAFGDKSLGRTCQYGYTSCNYNPRTPFAGVGDQGSLSAPSQVDREFKDLGPMVDEQQFEAKDFAPVSDFSEMGCQPMQAQPASSELLLDRDFAEPAKDQALVSQGTAAAGRPELGVKAFGLQSAGQEYGVLTWQMAVRSGGAENSANRCATKPQSGSAAAQLPCIVGYDVYVEDPSGALLRVASEQNSRNRPVKLTPESRFCLLTRTSGRYAVRAQLSSGASIMSWGNISKAIP
jgi:hypothetical protein